MSAHSTDENHIGHGGSSGVPQPYMKKKPRSPHSEVIRRWLFRLRAALRHPLRFGGAHPKEQEAECLKAFFTFTRLPAQAPLNWDKLDAYVEIALHVEDPQGGLLELPDTRPLRCMRKLSTLCGFSELEHHVLVWAYLIGFEEGLNFISPGLNDYRRLELVALLAKVLGAEPGDVEAAIRPDSPLVVSGLLVLDMGGGWSDWLDLSLTVRYGLYLPPEAPLDLLRGSLDPVTPSNLTLSDFPHLRPQLDLVLAYLGEATVRRQQGVNILFHGPPGTGKTELATVVAAALGLRLFAVANSDSCGDPRRGMGRLHAFAAAQMLLRQAGDAVILFDEMEGSFVAGGQEKDPQLVGLKGWLNRSLEVNPVPALWITNSVEALDPAYARRFDISVEVGIPPRTVRRAILDRHLADLPVSHEVRDHLAHHESLPSAVIGRAAKVVAMVRVTQPTLDCGEVFTTVVAQSLRAMGKDALKPRATALGFAYSLEYLQADADLDEIVAGFKASPQGRVCLYGPPGTGKTAFGHHLAQALDRPLLARRASDLQSKWVGEMEQNLNCMFRQAEREGSVVLLDEADVFLRDRRRAERGWEVSQVAELLTQLETFNGVFVASTNLVEAIDQAALRRFDLKISFGFMRADQAWAMFKETSRSLGLKPSGGVQPGLRALGTLTPGDFANILNQARLSPLKTQADLLARLEAECRLKPEGRRRTLGF